MDMGGSDDMKGMDMKGMQKRDSAGKGGASR
jgi:hypothetical protein